MLLQLLHVLSENPPLSTTGTYYPPWQKPEYAPGGYYRSILSSCSYYRSIFCSKGQNESLRNTKVNISLGCLDPNTLGHFFWKQHDKIDILRLVLACSVSSNFDSTAGALVIQQYYPLHSIHSNILLRASSAHSNSVLIFPNNVYRHTCHCLCSVEQF